MYRAENPPPNIGPRKNVAYGDRYGCDLKKFCQNRALIKEQPFGHKDQDHRARDKNPRTPWLPHAHGQDNGPSKYVLVVLFKKLPQEIKNALKPRISTKRRRATNPIVQLVLDTGAAMSDSQQIWSQTTSSFKVITVTKQKI